MIFSPFKLNNWPCRYSKTDEFCYDSWCAIHYI